MKPKTRRQFLGDVGRGMLIAGVGSSLATDMGVSSAFASTGGASIDLGRYQPLVFLMREKSPQELQPLLVNKLRAGETNLKELVAAAALANAQTFGGQDYVGFHTEMALVPALEMARRLPKASQALPVLKVLYRNSAQIQLIGSTKETLRTTPRTPLGSPDRQATQLQKKVRAGDMDGSERTFAAMSDQSFKEAYNNMQLAVQDEINVHRFVLAHRTWELIPIVGKEHAHTMLRQCVRFCVDSEQNRLKKDYAASPIRELLPKLMDQYSLEGRKLGTKKVDDQWLEEMSQLIYSSSKEKACDAVAAAMAEGVSMDDVSQAISLAANSLVLRQHKQNWRSHGDSAGVHATDSANAWRNMAKVVEPRNAISGLLVSTFHTSRYTPFKTEAYPYQEHREMVKETRPQALLAECENAIRQNDQGYAAAAMQVYSEQGHSPQAAFELLLKYAISEDGRLHGEKFFQTCVEEFESTRPAFRWRQLVGLAKVTASAYGYDRVDKKGTRAPGYEEARRLLKLS